MLRQILSEAPVKLKQPQSPHEKSAFIDLVKWAGDKMQAPESEIEDAIAKAKREDWEMAIDLLRTFYVMKGIKVQSN